MSRTSCSVKNILSGGVNKILLMILPFISRTAILYILSIEYLGLGSLFSSILQILNMTELGFSSAVVFGLYKPLAEKDEETICGLMTFYRRVYLVLGLIIFTIGICLTPFLRYLIKGSLPEEINIYAIYYIYLINTCITYVAFAYKSSLLQADQKIGKVSNIHSIITCLQYVVQIAILLISKNYYLYLICLPIFSLCYNIVLSVIVDKMYPQYLKIGRIQEGIKKDLVKQVKGVAVSKICGVMRDSIDSITISAFVSITAVAIYGNYFYIISALHGMLTVISAGVRASVGNSIATETKEKNLNDLLKFNLIYLMIATWCSSCMLCLYQDFMTVWVGSDLLMENVTMMLFVFYFYTMCLSDIRNVYVEAKGLWWQFRLRSVIECVANLILNITLVSQFGILGIVVATLITYWFINIGYGTPILFKNYFGLKNMKPYAVQCIKYTLINILVCGGVYFVCSFINLNNEYLQLIFKAMLCCVLTALLLLLMYLPDKHFKESISLAKSIFRRKKT